MLLNRHGIAAPVPYSVAAIAVVSCCAGCVTVAITLATAVVVSVVVVCCFALSPDITLRCFVVLPLALI